MVTVAPGTTAPLESVTVPRSKAVSVPCDTTIAGNREADTNTESAFNTEDFL
jgi:hypothetical protein